MRRKFQLKPGHVTACPQCGNTETFIAVAERCAEDCCETWIECKCGHAPPSEHRRECVCGDVSREAIQVLMRDRDDWLREVGEK